jgi:hypothetical protein
MGLFRGQNERANGSSTIAKNNSNWKGVDYLTTFMIKDMLQADWKDNDWRTQHIISLKRGDARQMKE